MTVTALGRQQHRGEGGYWLAVAGLAALAIPTFITLGRQVWSAEGGVHGPIVLATGLWMLARQRRAAEELRAPGKWLIGAPLLILSLLVYVVGRVFDFISFETFGLVGTVVTSGYLYFGGRVLRAAWFPVLWLFFLVPPPGWVVDRVTAPLKEFVSYASTGLLSAFDYPILRQGVTLFIGPYQLLVEDACSGLRSLSSLLVVTLLYIYIKNKPSWGYALFIAMLVVPMAVATNILRIVLLVLITFYMGDAAAQSFLHVTTGMVMFVVALLGIFAIDWLVEHIILWSRRSHVQPA